MVHDEDRQNAILVITQGDAERAKRLRANIAVFARRLDDPEVTRKVDEVLRGQRSVRDVFRTRQFQEVANRNFEHFERALDRLPPGDRERLLGRLQAPEDEATDPKRLDSLRDADLASSPVDDRGEVEPGRLG